MLPLVFVSLTARPARIVAALLLALLLLVLVGLAIPDLAAAADAPPREARTFVLPMDQVWTIIAAAVITLPTYALNHYAPWVSEPVKATVLVICAAVSGGIVQAIVAGGVGFNDTTLQFVITAVAAALLSHKILWLPSGISTVLKGGTNAPSKATR